jgi:digeranylgeranylglycerophospholipid reductase
MTNRWDICVIGAGPSGAYSALKLAQAGFRVLILEEHEIVGEPRHCTGILGQEAYEKFPDLPREVIQSELTAAWLVSPSGERVRTPWFQGKAVVIDRARFDQSLAAMASQAGAVLQPGCRVNSLTQKPDGVSLGVTYVSGTQETLEARMVVIASGVSYRLLPQVDLVPPQAHLLCAQTEVQSTDVKEVEVYIGKNVAPGSFAWAVPCGERRLRVGVTSHARAGQYLETLLTSPLLRDKITRGDKPVQKRLVPISSVASSVSDRIVVVGDAAGQVKPTTGGGIFYGLIGANLASQMIVKAFAEGRFHRRFLQSYDREWKRVLRGEAWMGRIGRKVFEHFSDQQLDRLVRVCGEEKVVRLVKRHADFDWHSRSVLSFLTTPRVLSQLF